MTGPARLRWLLPSALGGGALTTLALPPTGFEPLAVIGATIGLFACAAAGTGRRGALCGLAWGLGFCGLLFGWALQLDLVAYLALVPVQAVFWAGTGAVAARFGRQPPAVWVGVVTATWTLLEAVRARWPLGGFEWGQLGLSSADGRLRSASAVVGALGVTALEVALAAGLVALVIGGRRSRRGAGLTLGTVVLLTVGLAAAGAVDWTSPAGSLDVAVVQIDDPCPGRFAVDCPDFQASIERRFIAGTAALDSEPDLVLWGEGALSAATPEAAGRQLLAEAGRLPAPLLAGTTSAGGQGQFYNRNVLYGPDGTVADRYAKLHPVPFGEYVPLRDLLGGIGDVGRLVPLDMVAGDAPGRLSLPTADGGVGVGTVVSWEVTFARHVRAASHGSQLLTTLTTQATYGTSPVSDQLLGIAQLRAAELQKPLVVAATTGRSAIILPGGERNATTALYDADRLTARVPLRNGATPYARVGDLPTIALVVAAAVVLWLAVGDRPSRPRA